VLDSQYQMRFELLVLPHPAAAFNIARWLLRSGVDAEDAAQEAMLCEYRFLHGLSWRGRAGLPAADRAEHLVHQKNRPVKGMTQSDALQSLSPRFREAIVLRELEGRAYQEIATTASIPIGTVMSTLSRACRQRHMALAEPAGHEIQFEL